jgi:hypothetical protein
VSHPHEAFTHVELRQVEYVRSRPELYFQGPVDHSWLLGLVVSGALAHGARDLQVTETDGWWSISSSFDWLGDDTIDAFFTLKPSPATGPNTHRMEILLLAFAEDVWTAAPGDPVALSRPGPAPEPVRRWLATGAGGRLIVFRFAEAPESLPRPRLAVVAYDEALEKFPEKRKAFP